MNCEICGEDIPDMPPDKLAELGYTGSIEGRIKRCRLYCGKHSFNEMIQHIARGNKK